MNKKEVYKILGIVGISAAVVFSGVRFEPLNLHAAPIFAPVDAIYIVGAPNTSLTSEILTTQLTTNLIASSSIFNLGSLLKPWGSIFGNSGIFATLTANTFNGNGSVTISSGGTNQDINLSPSTTGKVLVGGDSVVVASKPSKPTGGPVAGQIYFDTTLGKFVGYNGTNWVSLNDTVLFDSGSLLSGLVSFWKMDEFSDESAAVQRDDSFGVNHLQDNGTVMSAAGKIGINGANFKAAESEFLSLSGGLNLTNKFSVSLWVKPESAIPAEEKRNLITEFDSNIGGEGLGWHVSLRNDSGVTRIIVFYTNNDGNSATWRRFNETVGIGTFRHIVATVDVSAGSSGILVYLDGIPLTEHTHADAADTLQDADTAFEIGARTNSGIPGSEEFFDGIIDEVGVWSRVLTPVEVGGLYNNGNGISTPF